MADTDRTTEILRRLATLVAQYNLTELTVEEDGMLVQVKGASGASPDLVAQPAAMPAHVMSSIPQATVRPPAPDAVVSKTRLALESPMVGVFYRSAAPEDPPFVNVGDSIHVGQPIGLIEAMKVYSELPSEVAGRIVEITAENGKLVRQGQPLLYVEPA